ncbi:hypothetical protein EVG20_g6080 [Dentipellis fragilis]|uniref:HhH-GPD domain-containing protein n=1 Tax=Dentipellis fragilis TaxID=205917 RepID=A0A4Y9YNQ3_9AGAM|nr:hypothetical protein EVG20_g6080 [Dentipellis fragilis]
MARGVKRRRSPSPVAVLPPKRETLSPLSPLPDSPIASSSKDVSLESPRKTKKLKALADFTQTSPFPDFTSPTAQEASTIYSILAAAHPQHAHGRKTPSSSLDANSATTCGKVANVIDSLIGTILSQNTSSRNSTSAKLSLDAAFGRHGFAAMATAPRSAVVDAIRQGGLANRKAAIIQGLLQGVHARHGAYSLQHLADARVSDTAAMEELVSYDGVGPKTAACVLLFCLGRDAFAVDTHVFRLSRLLGWVPPRADRVQAQMHLDVRVPAELKYALHVLMVTHGRACKGCKSGAARGGDCPLKRYLKERKGVQEEVVEAKAEEEAKVVAG